MRQPSKGAFELTEQQRARLERRLREAGITDSPQVERIVSRRNGSRYAPLSFAQQRLWFLDQLEPGNPFYNIPSFIRLGFALDVDALRRSLDEIVRRHEVLRTTFETVDGEPVQIVQPARPLSIPIVDLAGLPDSAREAETGRLATEEARRPFDLAHDLPVRASLLRLGPDDHLLLLTTHHIASDGWSTSVFSAELATLYRAFSEGRSSPLRELDIQYADFSAWQRQWMSGERLEQQLGYWRKQLSGLTLLELPTDHPRPGVATHRGAFHSFSISRTVSDAVQALARDTGVTPFMLLAAAFNALLRRYTCQDDVVIGAPIANRTLAQTEPLIGFFVNTLVLRTDLSGDPTFLELMARVKAVALQAYAHQDVPFERLVEDLEPERSLSSNPLFQVGFVLQTAWNLFPGRDRDLDTHYPAGATSLDVERGTSIFDMAVHLWETPMGFHGGFEYSTDLFDTATVARLSTHFVNLLESGVRNPKARVSELALMTSEERAQLMEDFSGVLSGPGEAGCVHDLLMEQAQRTPESIALVFGEQTMTWRALNEEANQLAHYLRSRGAGPEVRVGICMQRSLRMIVSVLAVLKAGAAYVPVDPAYPRQRRDYILQHANVALLLTDDGNVDQPQPPATATPPALRVDAEWDAVSPFSRSEPAAEAMPENLAYIIYTSGSTGTPKAVLLSHQGLGNMANAQRLLFGLSHGDRVLQFASLTFDASIFEIVMALGSGATLHLAQRSDLMPGPNLASLLRDQAISIVTLPPSALAALGRDEFPALHTVCVAGEACPAGLAAYWSQRRRFFNLYGPTETTVWATYAACHDVVRDPPIGRPIPHVSVYVLDEHLEPVPIGVCGELCIGGIALARGYAGSPDQTAERFIRNPFARSGHERLYRTGDRARFLPDGRLEYRGRLDTQIKLRGHRIELGEIESVLNGHPGVQEAVVTVRDDSSGDRRLIAYLIQRTDRDAANAPRTTEEAAAQVSYWHAMYDETYGLLGDAAVDPAFDFHGWNSSYTGEPIPAQEMIVWLDHTVDRVLEHRPRKVLEIGCGNGLVLSRLLTECTELWGTDFSASALRMATARLRAHPSDATPAAVTLLQRDANDFAGLPRGHFDVVVLNSVVQYFPGVDYLLDVIKGAAELLAPDGCMYLGDLRSLPLLEAFHTSVELQVAEQDLTIERLRERVRRRLRQEQELVLDPRFFDEVTRLVPQFGRARVELKRGTQDNELTKFRYDVTLLPGGEPGADAAPLVWTSERWDVAQLDEVLDRQPTSLSIVGIPNARVSYETAAVRLLANPAGIDAQVAGQLRAAARAAAAPGLDPHVLWIRGADLGYDTEVTWSQSAADCFDVRFRRQTRSSGSSSAARRPVAHVRARPASALRRYANDPLSGRLERTWLPDIRHFLEQRLPDYMVPATFVALSDFPRNASGKVDRAALPAPDAARPDLKDAYRAPRTPEERALADIWASVLGVERVGIQDNFFELGGDSILSIQIIARAGRVGLTLTPKDLFQYQTIAGLSSVAQVATTTENDQQPITGSTLLTPIQRWFFELDLAEPSHFNQSIEMDAAALDEAALRRTLECLLTHHDALRARFVPGDGSWVQLIETPGPDIPFHCEDMRVVPGDDRDAALQASVLRWQSSLSLENGPLVRLVLLRRDDGADRLLWVIHHLVVDGVSWRILVEDMKTAYDEIRQGHEPRLPRKTTSFRTWAGRLHEYAQSPEALAELPFWLDLASARPAALPCDHVLGPNDGASAYSLATTFSREDTDALLKKLPEMLRVRINETLITALAQSLAHWTGSAEVLVDLEGHGREAPFDGVDVSRTVGWFTSLYPVVLKVNDAQGFGDALVAIKERLRRVPNGGIGYGALRYLRGDPEMAARLGSLPQAEIAFNYLGQFAAAGGVTAAETTHDSTRSHLAKRRHAIEVNASVTGGQLRMQWTFSANLHARSSAERLIADYGDSLSRLIARGRSNAPTRFTPSDFEHARVSQKDLDRLVASLQPGPAN